MDLKDALAPSRIVPVVGIIVGALVTAGTGYLAANGFNLDPAVTTGIVTPLALAVLASVFKWQQGWQAYEAQNPPDQSTPKPDTTDMTPPEDII